MHNHFVSIQQLDSFDLCSNAIWIFDVDRHVIWWGNHAALEFWKAPDVSSLRSRDFSSDSDMVRTRLRQLVAASRESGSITEQWTLYPNNEPVDAHVCLTVVTIDVPERAALLIEVVRAGAVDPLAQRILDAARITPFCVSMLTLEGEIIAANPAAIEAYGDPRLADDMPNHHVSARFTEPGMFEKLLEFVGEKQWGEDVEVVTIAGRRWRRLALQRGRDPVDGAAVLVLTEEDMTERVALVRELEDTNAQLEARIDEQERTETALRAAKIDADRANQAKTKFLASMSHELRTPMNAVLGFAQLLELDQRDPRPGLQAQAARQIMRSGSHLLELINDLLDLAKIEYGNLSVSLEAVNIDTIISDCLSISSVLAEKHSVRIVDRRQTNPSLTVRADPTRLRQALLNLLSNAVKYNRRDGLVTITCAIEAGERLRIRVSDTGLGIPAERMDELFQPFNRLGREAGGVEGTGVGLTITQRLMELMDGSVDVESQLGRGSVFSLVLPCTDQPQAGDLQSDQSAFSTADAEKTVLYVEDSDSSIRLMQAVFEQLEGVGLQWAPDARIGLELAGVHRPNLIIMDINLPGLNGFEALRLLREDPATNRIPVIALSALASPSDIKRGLDEGFDLYLTKPLKVDKLIEAIHDFVPIAARGRRLG